MQDHRNGGVPRKPPSRDSLDYLAQRTVLLELIADPPDQGDRLDELIERLDLPPHSVEPAVAALELVGLAEGDVVRASLAASYFEYRWPVHLLTELARAELARRVRFLRADIERLVHEQDDDGVA